MEIWIWIVAAIVISLFVLRKQKISFEHYIWILLPIDMYGISVGGATIKPYMIFSFVLLVRMLFKRDKTLQFRGTWAIAGLFVTIAVVLVNILNNDDFSSVKAAFMIVVVYACVIVYISNCGESTFRDVPKAIIAAGIGYGLVFVVGVLLTNMGAVLPGVIAEERTVSGFYANFGTMFEEEYVESQRLRGFTIDPNNVIGSFSFCCVIGIIKILKGEGRLKEWSVIVLTAICAFMSGSRMGLICFILLIVITIVMCYRITTQRIREYIKFIGIVLLLLGIIAVLTTDIVEDIYEWIYSIYGARSGLTDEFGRFTIWKDAISVLAKKNPILGVGINQTQYYTATGLACHSTWLEAICGCGVFVGCVIIIYFIYPLTYGIVAAFRNVDEEKKVLLWSMALGILVIIISLVSVDNVTYSYLWFGTALLYDVAIKSKFDNYIGKEVNRK